MKLVFVVQLLVILGARHPTESFIHSNNALKKIRLFGSSVQDLRKQFDDAERRLNKMLHTVEMEKVQNIISNYEMEASQPDFWVNVTRARHLTQELERFKMKQSKVTHLKNDLEEAKLTIDMVGDTESGDDNPSLDDILIQADVHLRRISDAIDKWQVDSVLKGPYDSRSCRLYVRSGAGGIDAQVSVWCDIYCLVSSTPFIR
jgi:hypothetical protein